MKKILKLIPLFYSLVLIGQETDTLDSSFFEIDSLAYKMAQNSFSKTDEIELLGYNFFLSSPQTNFGAPIIDWYWQSNQTSDLRIGDRILEFGIPEKIKYNSYYQKYPHTKIVYAQTYVNSFFL